MTNSKTIRPQEVCFPVIGGIDYGVHLKVFARTDTHALVLKPGHTAYISRGSGSKYAPTELIIVSRRDGWCANYPPFPEGGRWNIERIKSHRELIDKIMGDGITDALEWDATFALGEQWLPVVNHESYTAWLAQKKADAVWRKERKEAEKALRLQRWSER